MDRRRPAADCHPQLVQYAPADNNMLKSVPPLVRPRSRSLALVRTNTSANLNFRSSAPTTLAPAVPLANFEEPCLVASALEPPSTTRLSSAIRAEMIWCCDESGGRRSSA